MKPDLLAQIQWGNIYNDVRNYLGPNALKLPAGGVTAAGPAFEIANLGNIISIILPYVFILSGLILFVFLIFGGFQLLLSAGNPESVKSGQGKITSALIGFIIIFVAYWLVEILQIVFGISILK